MMLLSLSTCISIQGINSRRRRRSSSSSSSSSGYPKLFKPFFRIKIKSKRCEV